MRSGIRIWVLFTILAAPASWAAGSAYTLYNSDGVNTPEAQGKMAYAAIPATSDAVGAKGTSLSTTASQTTYAGWSNYNGTTALVDPAFPALDRTAGYQVSATFTVASETHSSTDRAGVSLIVLGSDKKGIELGFWTNQIFAQNDASTGGYFTHGESVAADTTASTTYTLQISATTYALYTGGATPILTGSLRDYSGWTPGFLEPDPYVLPNFIFYGDDTTHAAGSSTLSSLQVTVPEPSAALLILIAPLTLRRRK